MAELTQKDMRQIVREETVELKVDVSVLKTDVAELKADVVGLKDNMGRLGSQFEDLNSKVDTIHELITPYSHTRKEMGDMGQRMDRAEADIQLLKLVVKKQP